MIKFTETKVEVIKKEYHFYCDYCETFLGSQENSPMSLSSDNSISPFVVKITVPNYDSNHGKYLVFNKLLCDKCRNSKYKEIVETLRSIGFE